MKEDSGLSYTKHFKSYKRKSRIQSSSVHSSISKPYPHISIGNNKSIMMSTSITTTVPVKERGEPKPSTQQQHRQAFMGMHNATCISQQLIKLSFN